jgi:hypothetical protein
MPGGQMLEAKCQGGRALCRRSERLRQPDKLEPQPEQHQGQNKGEPIAPKKSGRGRVRRRTGRGDGEADHGAERAKLTVILANQTPTNLRHPVAVQGNRTSLIEDRGGVRDIGRLRRHGGAGL